LWSRNREAASSLSPPRPVRFELPPPPAARFGSNISSLETTTIAFSPDGTRLAFIATSKDAPARIFIRGLEDELARVVPGTEGAVSVFWSPDNRSLGFFAAGKLRRIDQAGGAAVPICDVPQGIGLSGTWGSSGDILFSTVQGDAIRRVSASGGTAASPVIRSNNIRSRVLWPRYLPDGQRFLYTWMGGENATGEVVLVDRDGTERSILPAVSQAQFVEPDIVLVVRESTLIAQRVDLSSGRPIGEPVSVIGPVAYSAATGWAEVTASPNGMLALQTHRDVSRMTLVNRSGTTERTVSAPGTYLSVRAAPDGSALLFSRLRPELGTYDIWTTNLARGSETPLTNEPGMETGEVWLPGMQSIVMAAARGGPPNLFLRDLVSGKERRLVQSPRFHFPTDVSPDGKIVAYQQRTERGNWDLMQVLLDDTNEILPIVGTPASETDLRFAPTGGRVAFVSDESGRAAVYVAPVPLTAARAMVSSDGGFAPRWRRDGRELYYMSLSGTLMSAPVTEDGRPGNPVPLFPATSWANFDVMDNGARFVAIVRESVGYEQPLTVLLNWRQMMGTQ
jgi:Tol biopolymer transport system component